LVSLDDVWSDTNKKASQKLGARIVRLERILCEGRAVSALTRCPDREVN
jgi:hypothetical protein